MEQVSRLVPTAGIKDRLSQKYCSRIWTTGRQKRQNSWERWETCQPSPPPSKYRYTRYCVNIKQKTIQKKHLKYCTEEIGITYF